MSETEEYTIECSICLEESSVDNFYQITYGIDGQEPIKSIIVEEGCKGCLLTEDIRPCISRKRIFDYEIINQEKYIKARKINWVKKVLQEDPKDLISLPHMTRILREKKTLRLSAANENDNRKSVKDFLKIRVKDGLIEDLVKIPTTLSDSWFTYVMKKSDLYKIIDLESKGKFKISRTHRVPIEKLKELERQEYVVFVEKNGDFIPQFFVNERDRKTPCRQCGEVQSFDKFRYTGKNKDILTFECLKCESKKVKDKYDNLSPEEYEKFLVRVKTWRRANNDKCRGYERTPKARASRNVRNRLKKFLKGAKDHHFSKGIGCTKKELTEHLQSQFVEGMSWGNYGSGENGDHVGSWHIDHIIPISKFKGEFPNHYTNLQPMWSIDNMRKGNKVDTPV